MTRASQTVVVVNPSGLHARPATELSRLAGSLESSVQIAARGRSVNGASVLGVMSLGIGRGDEIEVTCDGPTADIDLDTLITAVESGLGESLS
ncbi:HPr family phosphocarrier protein [Schumannella luteola]|uniref:Phosphocarrier protein HPr n=1 Tax=Schumannella luteola TaxID=472059 RepID=A0A852Y7R0_9MICO|nr:phosphotransferase system HPr (HPr) family protein [Schumannella luteola]TPW90599.1 HPr family phosphocarrier protein [Schumannella luteola]